jgi:hypothetical protein
LQTSGKTVESIIGMAKQQIFIRRSTTDFAENRP